MQRLEAVIGTTGTFSVHGRSGPEMDRCIEVRLLSCSRPFSPEVLAELADIGAPVRVSVLLDRDSVHGPSHLSSAFMHAARALLTGRSRARDPSVEVIRWLAGSHQVQKGLDRASPGPDTAFVLLCTTPEGWPAEGDGASMLPVRLVFDGFPPIPSLKPVPPDDNLGPWGRRKASRLLGEAFKGSDEDLEKEVLELVALTELV